MNTPIISMVVAMDESRGIGKDNRIPWHIKADLVRLKNLTIGHATILGRTSFESMLGYYEKSGRPTMSQRTHIVVTRDTEYVVAPKYGMAAHSIEEAIALAKQKEQEEIFIIGGQQIFQLAFDKVDRLYITLVKGEYGADTFFPDYAAFTNVIEKEEKESDGYTYTFLTLEK